jgi:hypothetical protein
MRFLHAAKALTVAGLRGRSSNIAIARFIRAIHRLPEQVG